MARPLRSTGITRFMATTEQSAPGRCFGTFGLAGPPLAPFPLAPPNRFSSSGPEPRLESRHFYPGHRMASNQVSAMLFPERERQRGLAHRSDEELVRYSRRLLLLASTEVPQYSRERKLEEEY